MEVGIVALGLGALGFHFGNNESNEGNEETPEVLTNDNTNNQQTIYDFSKSESVRNYVQQMADKHFEKSLDPVNTNVIPQQVNDIPHEELYETLDIELQQKAEQISK